MNKHSEEKLHSITCPFAVKMDSIKWDSVTSIVSLDDKKDTVIVELANKERYLVEIPPVLYDAIFKSGEDNVIEQDVGFNELS